jgi:hypothetical protein
MYASATILPESWLLYKRLCFLLSSSNVLRGVTAGLCYIPEPVMQLGGFETRKSLFDELAHTGQPLVLLCVNA